MLRKSQSAGFARRMRFSLRMCSLMLPGRSKSQALSSYFSESRYSSLPGIGVPSAISKPLYMPQTLDSVAASVRAHDEARPAAGLEVVRVDVRRVGEEVRPVILAHLAGQLGDVRDELLLRVAPGEVGVGLLEADLGELLHHLGPGEGLGEEDHVGMAIVHLADQPLPERDRLGVRVVDAEDLHPVPDPEQHDVAQRDARSREGAAVEVDVDDVLVLLRRVLGELDRSVRTPVEPFRMLLDPGMVGRALDREIERDLEAMRVRRVDEPAEVVERAELGMDRVVAAFVRADGVDAADVAGRGLQRVVLALAVGAPDRVDRREVEDVEAELADVRQPARSRRRRCRGASDRPIASAGTSRTRPRSAPRAGRRRPRARGRSARGCAARRYGR